ncbi:S41 family peptidase [Paenibacillus sp. HWE-109]|uniref:S41 family peptidase n=1 Tax=Paenibacillus sp. HWE-109 TaxID=1306526 RepID=UPI001EDDA481|nr:S41 family peptidase [Paenibacillus sp. HWE-109]UKS28506.1 S41 family peptidase [Paenibacillus sp. HWE-109]
MSYFGDVIQSFRWFTMYDLILLAINMIILIWYAVPIQRYMRWFDFMPSLSLLVAIASVLSGDTSLLAIVLYVLTAILFLCTFKKIYKPIYRIAVPKHRIVRAVLCLAGVIPLIFVWMIAGEVRFNPVSHFSEMSYSQAFVQLNERLSKEYPFGDWKKIDWNEMENKYEPLFVKAEQEKNKDLYYKTLRTYLFSLRDGHVKIMNEQLYEDNPVFKQEVGGSVGISTIQLDQGKVYVNLLVAGSPADKSGIQLGAEILSWDGRDVQEAYRSTYWSESPMATEGDQLINQGRFMTRTAIDKDIEVAYKNKGDHEIKKVTLRAYDDQFETLKKTKVKLVKTDAPVEGKVLSNGYGYVKIRYLLPSESMAHPDKVLGDILKGFQEKQIKGLIIDVRDNPGGSDDLVAAMAGYFVNKPKFYEYVSYYSRMTGKFEINTSETRTIQPAEPYYGGKLAIIINQRTGSSGEGLPILAKGLPNVQIVGFTSTNGSFGVVSNPIQVEMPEGYVVQFPDGRSLNADKAIQGDSDDQGKGGAIPDIRIPLNEQTFEQKVVQGQDVELNYAIQALENMK